MRLAVFGGSFDPPHGAHTGCVLWALETGEVDAVVLVPSGRHPFGKQPAASFEDRLEMTRRALEPFAASRAWASDIERPVGTAPTYMIDTLRALLATHPGASLRLLAGSDVLAELHKWKSADEVRALAPPLEVPRQGPGEKGERWVGALPNLSSSLIRQRLAEGQPVDGWVPARVLATIRERGLYGVRRGG